jgi:hypothetical protein
VNKKILFYSPGLNYRGITNSIVDYAHYNQTILGNESTIVYDISGNLRPGLDIGSVTEVIDKLKNQFNVIAIDSKGNKDFLELERLAEKYDLFYHQKSGEMEPPFITSTKHAVHAVFQFREPHGDKYAYISEWLSIQCSNGEIPFVPYVVDLPPPNVNLRERLEESKLGQYTRIEHVFRQIVLLDVTKVTLEELESIKGIGPKTARFFFLR